MFSESRLFAHLRGENCPPPPGGHFNDDRAKNVTSRDHVIQLTGTMFNSTLTKFHENRAKNVTSRVFTCFHYIHIQKYAPPTGGHVFHRSGPFSNSSEISIKPITNVDGRTKTGHKSSPEQSGELKNPPESSQ
ncbi:hypothetical protein DPMN_150451 [Dreissena polymorpha]|uniref:Uncharacterized protein n=1 Tax=Dreissena polymorpha TaxID=45954 RepID=A0A9D4FFR7_DREPO|nr:hypothetical protein DPMN_150451 [Dreissena polymorpha]